MAQNLSDQWRIEEGGFPGCPVGTIVAFLNDGDTAQVVRPGIGQVGRLDRATTTQTSSADGSTITLVNESEGWRAVLHRSTWAAPSVSSWETPGGQQWAAAPSGKSRTVAAALALILGGFGLHKFYLGKVGLGLVYLVLFWTGIPGIVAWIEGIGYLLKTDAAWAAEYGGPINHPNSLAIGCLWIVAILPILAILAIIGLIFLGGQVNEILSAVGSSV